MALRSVLLGHQEVQEEPASMESIVFGGWQVPGLRVMVRVDARDTLALFFPLEVPSTK